jgi:hypothetical protein
MRVLLTLAGLGAALWWGALWYVSPTHFRYRLTVELEVDGETRIASSVIAADYSPRTIGPRLAPGHGGHAEIHGVAPMFDLGSAGTLLCVLRHGSDPSMKHRETRPPYAIELPMRAYKLDVHYIHHAKYRAPATLDPQDYPMFVWVPAAASWPQARQLYYDQLSQALPVKIRILNITLSPNPAEDVVVKIEPTPVWLAQLRTHAGANRSSAVGGFSLSIGQIETASPFNK